VLKNSGYADRGSQRLGLARCTVGCARQTTLEVFEGNLKPYPKYGQRDLAASGSIANLKSALISPQADRLRSPHGAPRKELKRRPFLGLHPGFTVPPISPLVGTRVPAMRTRLWVAAWRDFGLGRGALVLSIYCRLRHHRLRARTTSGAAAYNAQRKLNSLLPGSAVQPSAGRPFSHSFHSEVFSSARLLLSIPLVQLCPAPKPKTAPCSLPRPSAQLRFGDGQRLPALLPSPIMKRMFFIGL
jgi:hypothetical protein